MTDYPDKSKRKRTPNRRRRLLWLLLPMVALVLGLFALSPQIEVWLATDPFTPQCHFEEDRLFATGHPIRIGSVNHGQYEEIEDVGSISQISWSPDGTMLSARNPNGENKYDAVLMKPDGEIFHTLEERMNSHPMWSDDSQYISFNGNTIKVETGETDSRVIPMSGFEVTFSHHVQSPDEHYGIYGAYRDGGVQWYVTDLIEDVEWVIGEYGMYEPDSRFIGWSADSQIIYLTVDTELKQYDVNAKQLTTLLDLPYIPDQTSISPNHEYAILWDQWGQQSAIAINIPTLELITFASQVDANNLGWLDERNWLYGEVKNDDEFETLYLYDTVENSSEALKISSSIGRRDIELSPSRHYLKYVSEYQRRTTSSGYVSLTPMTYRVYDLYHHTDKHLITLTTNIVSRWFIHMEQEFLLIQKQATSDKSLRYLTTLTSAEDFSTCKIGYTSRTIEFQPHPQSSP